MAVACSPSAAAPSGSATSSASAPETGEPVAAADDAQCEPLDLVLASGEQLDLTGSWVGDDLGPYQLRQWGDCLWFAGQNNTASALFFGHLRDDFTVRGHWSTISASDHYVGGTRNSAEYYVGTGILTLDILVGDGGTNADVSLSRTSIEDSPNYGPGYEYGVTTWTRVDADPDHPIPGPSG